MNKYAIGLVAAIGISTGMGLQYDAARKLNIEKPEPIKEWEQARDRVARLENLRVQFSHYSRPLTKEGIPNELLRANTDIIDHLAKMAHDADNYQQELRNHYHKEFSDFDNTTSRNNKMSYFKYICGMALFLAGYIGINKTFEKSKEKK